MTQGLRRRDVIRSGVAVAGAGRHGGGRLGFHPAELPDRRGAHWRSAFSSSSSAI